MTNHMMTLEELQGIHAAFSRAITEMGLEALKRTSLFGSNDRRSGQ